MTLSSHARKHQSGAALVTALVILVVMMVVGTAGMEGTLLDSKMTMNFQERERAELAANSALRAEQSWLSKQLRLPTAINATNCSAPPNCGLASGYPIWIENELASDASQWTGFAWEWWETYGREYQGSSTMPSRISHVEAQPRGLIEYLGFNIQSSTGMATTLDPSKASQRIGPHYFYMYGVGASSQENAFAGIEITFQKLF